ncbi:MAG TPA: hypothetical protein VMQ81_13050 [Acidimicrobiia bacterium]|nr:hypothetical protein [Acidimicrobiia bacterium]
MPQTDAIVYRFPARRRGIEARLAELTARFDAGVRDLDTRLVRVADTLDAAVGAGRAAVVAGRDAFRTEWARRPYRSAKTG